jgi:Cu(I)/Ag(I) efflux system membrane fusion protein
MKTILSALGLSLLVFTSCGGQKKTEVDFIQDNIDNAVAQNTIQTDIIEKSGKILNPRTINKDEFIDAKINFVETQLNPADKTNRIRVYLNNNKFKLPIGLRLQGVVKTNSVNGIWIQKQSMVSIGNKKIVFLKMDNGFKASTIKTGIEIDDFIQIIEGISVKDTIAKNAQYLIDSESFIKTE